jgi:ribose/xylose/arabinose/galactoside ABC-type transport system permease subunit
MTDGADTSTHAQSDVPPDEKAHTIRLGSRSLPINRAALLGRLGVAGRLGGVGAAIIITGLVFQTQNQFFLSSTNLLGLLRSMTTLAILAFGETFVLVSGEIDLSLGAIYGLGAMSCGQLWSNGLPFWLAFVIAIGIGGAIGCVNAFLVTIVGVNSFVTTLGMLNLAQGVTYLISNASSFNPAFDAHEFNIFSALGNSTLWGNVPTQVAWLVGIGAISWFLLHRTIFGFRLAAIGGNPVAARAAHLPIKRSKFYAFAIAGMFAVLGGIIDFSLVGATDPSSGTQLTFPVFAAVIIGGASLSGGRGSIAGTVVGALLLETLTNGLSLIGVGTFAQLLFVGGIIIAAVALDRFVSRARFRVDVQV